MIPEITLEGKAFDRGYCVGARFKTQLENKLSILDKHTRKTWPHIFADAQGKKLAREMQENMVAFLQAHFPDIIDEIQGIAKGAEIDFERAFFVSAYDSIGNAVANYACSSLAFTHSDNGPLLGKTDDGCVDPRGQYIRVENMALMTVRPEYGHTFICINEAGTLWAECGVNECGLAIGTNSAHPAAPGQNGHGVPQHIVPRLVLLNCRNVPEAVEFIDSIPFIGKGLNIVLADESHNAVAVESAYTFHGMRGPEHRVVFSTNHYCSQILLDKAIHWNSEFSSSQYYENSAARMANLSEYFHKNRPELSAGTMREILTKKYSEGGLFQSRDDNSVSMETNYSVIINVKKRELCLDFGHSDLARIQSCVLQ